MGFTGLKWVQKVEGSKRVADLHRKRVSEFRMEDTSLSQQARVRASWSRPRASSPP